jgi:putative DNA primase/helicase
VRDALEALPRWDGRRRLDRWLQESLGAADTEYVRAVGRAWLVSAMARAFQPGCKADHLLLLEGGQGIGKSSALALVGGAGYKDLTFSAHDKDAMQDLRGAWVVEYSELSGLGKRDDEWLKGHIARAVDTYRASYGRESLDHPRACVLAGTTNPQGDGRYLRDSENRRYWPVACEASATTLRARLGWLASNRDQVLAEALSAYRAGEVWYLDRDVGQAAQQEARREIDPLEDAIPAIIGDDAEVDMRMLRCDPRLARDLPSSAVAQAKALAKVLRRLGFKPPSHNNARVWRRRKPEQ